MWRVLIGGLVYFLLAFGLGFLLGSLRVLVLVPRMGLLAAVAVEVPLMLFATWWQARWTVRKLAVPADASERLMMGAVAFSLLMLAEAGLAVIALSMTPAGWLAGLATPAGVLGLLGQIVFALWPWVQGRRKRHAAAPPHSAAM